MDQRHCLTLIFSHLWRHKHFFHTLAWTTYVPTHSVAAQAFLFQRQEPMKRGVCVCVGATIQGAPSRTLWYYFNVASSNCVEQVCFFSRGSNRGQPTPQPFDPRLNCRGGPGLRPVWSSTCWENFTQETLFASSLRANGFRSRGALCVKVNNTVSGSSLCWRFFYECFWSWPLAGQHHNTIFNGQWPEWKRLENTFYATMNFPHCTTDLL